MASSTTRQGSYEEHTPTRRVNCKGQVVMCNGCYDVVESELLILEAMGKTWHIECFRCTVCQQQLPESYYEENGEPYCKNDFYEKLAHKCFRCSDYITGPIMAVGFSHMYHPECFYCTSCGVPLGEKDTYCLLSSQEILCNSCSTEGDKYYETTIRNGIITYISIQQIKVILQKKVKFRLDGKAPSFRKKKSIRDFRSPQIPPPGKSSATKSYLKIERLPQSLQEAPLKTGDIILEINGIAIVDQNQEEINALMEAYDDCLYLTIERKRPVPQSSDAKLETNNTSSLMDSMRVTDNTKPLADSIEPLINRTNLFTDNTTKLEKAEIARPIETRAETGDISPETVDTRPVTNETVNTRPVTDETVHRPVTNEEHRQVTNETVHTKQVTNDARPSDANSPTKDACKIPEVIPLGNGAINEHRMLLSSLSNGRSPDSTLMSDPAVEDNESLPEIKSPRASAPNLDYNLTQSLDRCSLKELRSHRAQSVPAIDAQADYTKCFRLSDLEIGEIIGYGFYGNVIKVTHKHTGQIMVMKEMKDCSAKSKRTFQKEVSVLKRLNHPNVLHLIGILYQEGKLLTLITEYIPGGTLRRRIKRKDTPFPWKMRMQIAQDIAAGMTYLHMKGIIHRDLTSYNCLLRENMSAVVADFGLARIFQPITSASTQEKRDHRNRMTVVGSPYWMAPEMLKGDLYDESVDVFSFGIVLCEIIARVKSDPDELPRLQNFGLDEVKFQELCVQCPQMFYDLAVKCCSYSPDDRPHFHEIKKYLSEIL